MASAPAPLQEVLVRIRGGSAAGKTARVRIGHAAVHDLAQAKLLDKQLSESPEPSSSSSASSSSTQQGAAAAASLTVPVATVAGLRSRISQVFDLSDREAAGMRLFLAGMQLEDGNLADLLAAPPVSGGTTATAAAAGKDELPIVNVVLPVTGAKPSTQSLLSGALKSLPFAQQARRRSFADDVIRSSVEKAQVQLFGGRTWVVNGFKNGDVTIPPLSSKEVLEPLKHAVEINNCIDSTVTITGSSCVHLSFVNCKKTTIKFQSVLTAAELVHCDDVDIVFTGSVPTVQLDMCKRIKIMAHSSNADLDKTVFVCASVTDIAIHVRDETRAALGSSSGGVLIVDVPVSLLQAQTASKLHRSTAANGRIQWSLRTLGTDQMKSDGSKYVQLNLLDSADWENRRADGGTTVVENSDADEEPEEETAED